VRLVLPILPAICASSPILDGKLTGALDTRLKFYKTNQSKIPSITGKVIPEAVFSKRNYLNTIYEKIKNDIGPYDPDHVLNPIWVNSRGAIPRFDRGSIEIRVMDIQECPAADLAIVTLVTEIIKALASNKFVDLEAQMRWKTEPLGVILDQTITLGQSAIIQNTSYMDVFGYPGKSAQAGELWRYLVEWSIKHSNTSIQHWRPQLDVLVNEGTLSSRIVKSLGADPSVEQMQRTYKRIAACLAQNKMFLV
jgi:carboxylate-amine ligase